MTHFERVSAIFHRALDRDPAARAAFLDAECGDDRALRAEVQSLLDSHEGADGFMEVPAAVAAGLVAADAGPVQEGAAFGQYRVEREIGRGGMGIVYLAEDVRLGRKVAIKLLDPQYARDEHRRERMRLEARAAAALGHPGIATVFALEEIDGHLCLVCEYVPGETLRAEIERGPAPLPVLLDTGIQVADALAAAHAAGVVHRDLKPENVIRDERGRTRILDFGVARFNAPLPVPFRRLTDRDVVLGTPAYMSPEQLEGADVDGRSDVFALGVLLFELASGRHPFETATPASTAAHVLAAEPPGLLALNPAMPPAVERIIRRCLRKNPAERYQSAADVARDLEGVRTGPASGVKAVAVRTPASPVRSLTPRGWWVLHQVTVMLIAAVMVWPVATVHALHQGDWTLALLLGVIVCAAINGTLRAHLLFTNAFNAGELRAQLQRTEPWLRPSDWLFAALLLASGLPAARSHTVLAATMAAVAVGWMVASLVIEPATRQAAFPRRTSGARRRSHP